jgi:2-oxoglutarate dehydrogenase complex dehydrogenase (E1) component-like enzyme
LADDYLGAALNQYPDGTPVIWVQEEPANMGAWSYLRVRFGDRLFNRLPFSCVSRPASASPATGSANSHKIEQELVISAAFAERPKTKIANSERENIEHVNRIEGARSRRVHNGG